MNERESSSVNETPLLAMCMILICGVETLRNRVGHTLILVLQLTQFPGRKGRWNRKVARSAEKYCLTKVYAHLQLTTRRWRNDRRGSSAGKGFVEVSRKDHEKTWRSGVTAFSKFLAGTQWSVLHCITTNWRPLRWTGGARGVPSPCVLKTLGNRV